METSGLASAGVPEPIVPISALNHFLYCPRRCALIHVEGVFVENAFTLDGQYQHRHVDIPRSERCQDGRVERALPLHSARLGLSGKADVVEFHGGIPYPVDYKRGKRVKYDNDDVQLCAQALCLEEMLGVEVPAGAVFHSSTKRRREIEFGPGLRSLTEQTVILVRELLSSSIAPPAILGPRCDGCSLRGICLPEVSHDARRVARYCLELFSWKPEKP